MSNIVDRVFAEVCLDERISDGIFRMDEEQHMDALRDYFLKRGIPREAAIHVTNRMVEGKYPERQAWRVEDGILVTWPSPKHMADAMAKNPGKYTDKNPKPKEEPSKPEPKEPAKEPAPEDKPEKDDKEDGGKSLPKSSMFGGGSDKVKQGDKDLSVEPPRGEEKAEAPPPTAPPVQPVAPRTPERIAAEKEVAKQILGTSNNNLSSISPPLTEACTKQLTEILKYADQKNYRDAVLFLIQYVNP